MTIRKEQELHLLSMLPVIVGALVWLLVFAGRFPYSFFELTHVEVLLVAAPLYLIPLCWQMDQQANWLIWSAMISGGLFMMAFQMEKGPGAAGLIIPWLILVLGLAFKKVKKFDRSNFQNWIELSGYVFLPIGIFWTIIDRLGIQLLGYDPTIIILTAVHFHYAGFILPQVTAWLLGKHASGFKRIVGLGIIAGIPLVALGISSTHFQWSGWVEVICVTVMTLAGAAVGGLHINTAKQTKSIWVKLLFFIGGLSLMVGMCLAFCYGWRHVFVIETLTIPWMYAVHGTCNAIGFAVPILLAWKFKKMEN